MDVRDIDYRSIYEGMPIGISCFRAIEANRVGPNAGVPDVEFLSLNPEFERLTGLDPRFLVGTKFSALDSERKDEVRRWYGELDGETNGYSFTRPAVYSERYSTWCRISSFPTAGTIVTLVVPFASGLSQESRVQEASGESSSQSEQASGDPPADSDSVTALVTHDLRILEADAGWSALLGFDPKMLVGQSLLSMVDPDDRVSIENLFQIDRTVMTIRLGTGKGDERFFDLTAGAREGSFCVTLKDVTARTLSEKELTRSDKRYRSLFENSEDIIFTIDPSGIVLTANRAMETAFMTGLPDETKGATLIGQPIFDCMNFAGNLHEWMEHLKVAVESRKSVRFVIDAQDGAKRKRRYHVSLTPELEDLMRVDSLVGICRDITDMTELDPDAVRDSLYDALTGLPNRILFQDRLENSIRMCERLKKRVGVMFIDVDNFKNINDTMGHAVGDEVLKELARRFSANVRTSDTLARMGGDEFTVLLQYVDNPADVGAVLHRLQNCLNTPILVQGFKHYIGVSIGVAVHPDNGLTADEMLKNADAAMYSAKREGKSRFQYFSEEIRVNLQRRMEMGLVLREALLRNEMSIDYQPIVSTKSGATHSYEALLRWTSKQYGKVSPAEFIPIAEESGHIVDLGEFVLRRTCEACFRMNNGMRPLTFFAINISAVQFARGDFLKRFRSIVSDTGVNPMHLELEITESVLLGNFEQTLDILKALKIMGVRIILDDFGTGYSSLSYLRILPIDGLKIDKSFISDITIAHEEKVLVGAIILLAHKLGLDVVAEGVENSVQYNYLLHRDCDFIQGFYLRRPISDKVLKESMDMPF